MMAARTKTTTRPALRAGRVPLVMQILLWQLVVLAVSLGIGAAWRIGTAEQSMRDEYAQRALAISQSVASDPDVREGLEALSGADLDAAALADGELQKEAMDVTHRTGVMFVVIANASGLRLSHPDTDLLGKHVSTSAEEVLSGQDVLDTDRGTLGESVRGKAPVRAEDGRVIGFVGTGISTADVAAARNRDIAATIGIAVGALAVGAIGSALLARRWRTLTLGLQPEQLVGLVGEQRAVFHSLADGVLSVDPRGRIQVVNDRARELLSIDAPTGTPLDDIQLPSRLREIVRVPTPIPVATTVGERIVLAGSHRVIESGQYLGMVLSVVDRTDVERLTRELDSVRSMSEALRAQRHETANRFHVLSGLLRHGHVSEAREYLEEISGARGTAGVEGIDNVAEPHLHAFLDAKATLAHERGVALELGPQTWVDGEIADPVSVTTVLGNLIDNAVDAVVAAGENSGGKVRGRAGADSSDDPSGNSSAEAGRVEVELFADGDTLWITVSDTGGGIDPARVPDVFAEGQTTKDGSAVPGGRGLGLALARRLCRRGGGDLRLVDPGGPPSGADGAVFVAELRGAMEESGGEQQRDEDPHAAEPREGPTNG
ncbi:sensor histidine kinase [Dietzia sp.]|uniref:sensor histidine kinase n=1 Tax=Dietzia sp. TaxID=1871616 RepID=UPI002FDA7CB1